MKVTLIAAFDNERGIAKDGEIPWDIPEDLEHFSKTTRGHPVIVGRKTYENIGNLPGREMVVLSGSETYPGVYTVRTIKDALDVVDWAREHVQGSIYSQEETTTNEVFVAGGESVYEQFIDHADRMVLTKVDGRYDCDQFFPRFSLDEWEMQTQSVRNEFSILEYERR